MHPSRLFLIALLPLALAVGCGEDSGDESPEATAGQAAAEPAVEQFPKVQGRSLEELANGVGAGLELGPATSRYTVGPNRLAFGLIDQQRAFVYAPTAVYVADSPEDTPRGPFLAPADSLLTEPAFRSKQAALEGDPIASIYATEINFPKPGEQFALVVAATEEGLVGAAAQLNVAAEDPIPGIGDPAPPVETETVEDSTSPDLLETREPADQMHEVSFDEAIGERPTILMFSTPALCESRVCGPVTDIAAQLQAEYGDRVEFIHQEPYAENDPGKGVRPPLKAFNLQTEPWLFAVDANGRVVDRLEGSFGVNAVELAVQRALGEA